MIRSTLSGLVNKLRSQLGESYDSSSNPDTDTRYKFLLNKYYEYEYEREWPDLRLRTTLSAVAGQQYYTPPAGVSPDSIIRAYVLDTSVVYDCYFGITAEHYAMPDYPIYGFNYDWVADSNSDRMELWPIPTENTTIYFECKQAFAPLVNDTDICLIDDRLIYLPAAIEVLRDNGRPIDALVSAYKQISDRLKSAVSTPGSIPNSLARPTTDGLELAAWAQIR